MQFNRHTAIRKVMHLLRRPFLHRFVTLLAATLLAMSLVSAALVLAASRSGDEVALISADGLVQEIFTDPQGARYRYILTLETLTSRHQFERLHITLRGDSHMERGQRS